MKWRRGELACKHVFYSYCPQGWRSISAFYVESITRVVQLHEYIQVSGFYFCPKATPLLGNRIPFPSSASIFSPVHSIFAIAVAVASKAWRIFVSSAIYSAQNTEDFPGNECWAKWKCVWSHSLSSGPIQYLPAGSLWDILRPSSQLSLRMSLSGVLFESKMWSSIEDFPCHLGRSPTWLLWGRLYPVLWKQDELGCEYRPEALYPIYVALLAGLWEVYDFTWELAVVCR